MVFIKSTIQFGVFHTPLLLFACLKASLAGSALTLAGFALTPSRLIRRLELNEFDFFAIGTAGFIACCWLAVTHGHSVTPVIALLLAAPPVVLLVRSCQLQPSPRDAVAALLSRLAPAIRPLLLFNLFGCLIYALHYWQLRPGMLPIVYSGNLDVYQYGNVSMHLLAHMTSLQGNIAGYDFQKFATTDVFGAFALLSILQFLPQGGPFDFAIPAVLLAAGGTCLVVFFSLKRFFGFGNAAAALLVVLFCANPLATYIIYNFFFSQMVSTLLLTVLFYGTLQRLLRPNTNELRQVVVAVPIYVAQLLCYPPGLLLTCAVHCATMLVPRIARHDMSVLRNVCSRKVVLLAAWVGVLVSAALLLICLAFPARAEAVWSALQVESKVLAGWPLGLISPLVVAGTGALREGLVDQSSFAVAGYTVILATSIALPVMLYTRHGAVRKDAQEAFTAGAIFAILLAAYLAIYLMVGPSYQQWKFASYAPQAFNWILAAELLVLCRHIGRRAQWLRRVMPGFAAAAIIVAVGLDLDVVQSLRAVQVTSSIETMSAVDKLPIERIALDTEQNPDNLNYATQTAAPSYIRRPELYMAWGGLAYPDTLPAPYHPSPDFPLLTNKINCGSADSGGVLQLRDGFEIITRGYLPIGTMIDFHHSDCAGLFAASGTGVAEPGGRWTEGHETKFHIRLDPAQLPGDLLVSLVATPFTAPDSPEQQATVSVNGHKLAVWQYPRGLKHRFDLLVPHVLATQRPELEIDLQLPNALSLVPYSNGADHRVVALVLDTLTLRNARAGAAQ